MSLSRLRVGGSGSSLWLWSGVLVVGALSLWGAPDSDASVDHHGGVDHHHDGGSAGSSSMSAGASGFGAKSSSADSAIVKVAGADQGSAVKSAVAKSVKSLGSQSGSQSLGAADSAVVKSRDAEQGLAGRSAVVGLGKAFDGAVSGVDSAVSKVKALGAQQGSSARSVTAQLAASDSAIVKSLGGQQGSAAKSLTGVGQQGLSKSASGLSGSGVGQSGVVRTASPLPGSPVAPPSSPAAPPSTPALETSAAEGSSSRSKTSKSSTAGALGVLSGAIPWEFGAAKAAASPSPSTSTSSTSTKPQYKTNYGFGSTYDGFSYSPGAPVTSASATFTVPTVTPKLLGGEGDWVGISSPNTDNILQGGLAIKQIPGYPVYEPFAELFDKGVPATNANDIYPSSITFNPGDVVKATTSISGSNGTVTLDDETSGQTFSHTFSLTSNSEAQAAFDPSTGFTKSDAPVAQFVQEYGLPEELLGPFGVPNGTPIQFTGATVNGQTANFNSSDADQWQGSLFLNNATPGSVPGSLTLGSS